MVLPIVSISPHACMTRSDSSSIDTARGSSTVPGFRSMTRVETPSSPSRLASVSPVGPAPTMMTSKNSGAAVRLASTLIDDRIDQQPDVGDFDLYSVSRLHEQLRLAVENDPSGGACRDYITRRQRRELRQIFNENGDRENQLIKSGRLHGLAVQARFDLQLTIIGDLISGD